MKSTHKGFIFGVIVGAVAYHVLMQSKGTTKPMGPMGS
jgi:hypothetical protein